MPEPIDLTETAPGQWSFVRRLRLKGPKRRKPTAEDMEARREAFFDSLAGEAIKPRPDYTGAIVTVMIALGGAVACIALGAAELWWLPLFIAAIFPTLSVLIGLCMGHTLREAILLMLRS
jgi:hypothetical protein